MYTFTPPVSVLTMGITGRNNTHNVMYNTQVAEYMLLHGRKRNPMITGSSVHNQRIERLWRDTYRCVIAVFYQIFYYLEEREMLDPVNELDLFCLHSVYKDKINDALKSFVDGWNSHGITTEHNMTPTQLFARGVLMHSVDMTDPYDTGDHRHSVDLNAPSVVVPDTPDPLTLQQQAQLAGLVATHNESDPPSDYYMDTYATIRSHVYQMNNN